MAFHPLPRAGDRIEIETYRGDSAGHWRAAVIETTDDGLVICLPEAGGETVSLKIEEKIKVKYHHNEAGYEFLTPVLALQTRPFPLVYLLKPDADEIEKRQLREYVRVDTNLPVQIARQGDVSGEAFAGMILNISGGGLKVSTMVEFRQGDTLRFRFELPEEHATVDGVVGEVVTVRPNPEGGNDLIVQFKGIETHARDLIAKYVLDLQIKLRRRGKVAEMRAAEEHDRKAEK